MPRASLPLDLVLDKLEDTVAIPLARVGQRDEEVRTRTAVYAEELLGRVAPDSVSWESFVTFWPPRLVQALKREECVCFFGAGLSLASGLPTWSTMLRDYFGLDAKLLSDEDLTWDALTQAELASHQIGADQVQTVLRTRLSEPRPATTNHLLLAALSLPFYVTTNYDGLFEQAWRELHPHVPLEIVANDSSLISLLGEGQELTPSPGRAVLFKIHGDVAESREHLILTRSDYRRHYRQNQRFFTHVTQLLGSRHVLFLGFSHRDPEVTRLVDDAIWNFERGEEEWTAEAERLRRDWKAAGTQGPQPQPDWPRPEPPNFYSLQFQMKEHTPEIFAARGIVALAPALADPKVSETNFNSSALGRSLVDLIGVRGTGLAEQVSMYAQMNHYATALRSSLCDGLDAIGRHAEDARRVLEGGGAADWLAPLRAELGERAGQGVYLLDENGRLAAVDVPDELTNPKRRIEPAGGFRARPYFRQARTYREPFVSDFFRSMFNGNLTFALCVPVHRANGSFMGLLFAACQPGAWRVPIDAAEPLWDQPRTLSILVVDANGVALLPPNGEFEPQELAGEHGEPPALNRGYSFTRMLALSRRDKLISRLMENVVPLRQDDDVLSLGADLRHYTVVTELVGISRWKIGISEPVALRGTA